MDSTELVQSLGMALGLGLLIGLQREQSQAQSPDERRFSLGGIRTFPLFALGGALSVLLGREIGAWMIVLVFVAMAAPLALAYADDVKQGRDRGLTTESAFILTFLLGALLLTSGVFASHKEKLLFTAGVAVAVTALLSLKKPLHEIVARVSSEDIYATVKFAVVAVIVLPLLPDRTLRMLDHDFLNPRTTGLMVVLIAGIGFMGYVAVRVLGPGKGLGITGLLGGLVSSTAVTLSFSGRSKRDPAVARECALGVVLACTLMVFRVVAAVAVVNPSLVRPLLWPLGGMALGGLGAGFILYYGRKQGATGSADPVKLANPFELTSAVKFGFMFAAVLFIADLLQRHFGASGLYLAGLLAGTTDVDAITLSVANLTKQGLAAATAVTTILLAAWSNTLVKGGMAVFLGGPGFRLPVGLSFGAMILGGALGLAVVWLA